MKRFYLLLMVIFLFVVVGCNNDNNEIQPFLVSFDSNGGSLVEPQKVEKGEKISKPNDPTKNGYTFDGWYLGSDEWSFIGYVVSNDMTLSAKWSPTTYNIIYHNVDELDNSNPTTYNIEEEVSLKSINKVGYVFGGFYLDSNFTNSVSKIDKGTTGDIDLFAKFSNESYNINFDVNGGNELENSSQVVSYNEAFMLPTPTRSGYSFDGWFLDDEKIESLVYSYTNDIELKAKWVANHYTISYDVNGGDSLLDNTQDVVYCENYEVIIPTRNGYTFDGWYQGDIKIESGMYLFANDIELKAKWQIVEYNIIYHVDSVEDCAVYTVEDELNLSSPSKEGYSFAGWYLDSEFTKLFTKLVKGTTGDINLYARFTANKYNIHLDVNSGNDLDKTILEIDYNEIINLPSPTKTGYTFVGWFNGSDLFDKEIYDLCQDVELTAHWTANEYTITYNTNGGNQLNPSSIKVYYDSTINLAIPTRDDYVFVGWSYDGSIIEIDKCTFAGNITLVAEWQKIKYIVSFDSTGGSEVESQEIEKGEKVSKPSDPTKSGYEFVGWYLGNDEWSFVGYVVTKEITLTAKWNINTYTINYNLDGGTNNELNPNSFTVEDEVILNNPSKAGFTFVGWYLDVEYASSIEKIEKGNVGNINLYAKFSVNTYTITYDVNGGDSLDSATQSAIYGYTFVLKIPTKEGYSFAGWMYNNNIFNETVFSIPNDVELVASWTINQYTLTLEHYYGDSDLVLTQDYNSQISVTNPTIVGYTFSCYKEVIPSTMPADNITIEVLWMINQYTLTIKYNDGLTEDKVLIYDYNQTINTIDNPTRLGYTFNGWNIQIPATMPAEDVVINSTWTPNDDTQYIVNHYKQNIDNEEYTLFETDVLSGTTDSEILVSAKDYDGFTKPQEETIIIYADGSSCVNYYYTRNIVTVTIVNNNGTKDTVYTAKYEAGIDFAQNISREGYTYGGLFLDIRLCEEFTQSTMPCSDLTLYVWWQEETKPMYFNFRLGETEASITGSETNVEEIVIPYYIGGKIVTSVGERAFFLYYKELSSITLPDSIISIGDYAFYNCSSLRSIIIPSGVVSIGNHAFYDCTKLNTIVIPDNIKYIGDHAFSGCNNMKNINGNTDGSFIVPSGITSIGLAVFDSCRSLVSIVIPDSITSIGDYAFGGCDSIETVTIPNSVISIGNGAFQGCNNLKRINSEIDGTFCIPNSVEMIGKGAFFSCGKLVSITLPFVGDKAHTAADSYQYPLGYIFGSTENGFTSLAVKVTQNFIGENQSVINDEYNIIKTLRNVTITGETTITSGAFQNCSLLTSITITGKVTSIESNAFQNCSALTEITIPKSVTFIDDKAFDGCSSLKSIVIENENITINGNVFNGCELEYIEVPASVIGYIPKNNCKNLVLTTGEIISSNMFSDWPSITSIVLPDSTTILSDYAFSDCSLLTHIILSNSITSIGNGVFNGCSSLEYNDYNDAYYLGSSNNPYYLLVKAKESAVSVSVHSDCKIINSSAFSNCTSLVSITIPDDIEVIGSNAFSNCLIEYATIPEKALSSINKQMLKEVVLTSGDTIKSDAFSDCVLLNLVSLPNGIVSVGGYAFSNCSSLTSITIPDSVVTIGVCAFHNCSSLKRVNSVNDGEFNLPNNISSIGQSAFSGCSSMVSITIPNNISTIEVNTYFGCTSLTSITIPSGVSSIKQGAFTSCTSMESITIPNSVITIGQLAFNNCQSLHSIIIPLGVVSIGANAFMDCRSLEFITIPESVQSIADCAFENCLSLSAVYISNIKSWLNISFGVSTSNPLYYAHNLYIDNQLVTDLIVPSDITSIKDYTMNGCTSIATITISSSVTSIGYSAFSGCSSLTSITIHGNVTSIGSYAFSGCSSLTSIVLPSSVTSIGDLVFRGCSSLESISIPHGVLIIGGGEFNNCSLLTSINIPSTVQIIGDGAFTGCSSLQYVYYEGTQEDWDDIEIGNGNSYLLNATIEYNSDIS